MMIAHDGPRPADAGLPNSDSNSGSCCGPRRANHDKRRAGASETRRPVDGVLARGWLATHAAEPPPHRRGAVPKCCPDYGYGITFGTAPQETLMGSNSSSLCLPVIVSTVPAGPVSRPKN